MHLWFDAQLDQKILDGIYLRGSYQVWLLKKDRLNLALNAKISKFEKSTFDLNNLKKSHNDNFLKKFDIPVLSIGFLSSLF